MKSQKGIVVFDVAGRSFDVYRDVPDAAGHVGIPSSTLSYNLSHSDVYYTGTYFVGYGELHKSNRGRK